MRLGCFILSLETNKSDCSEWKAEAAAIRWVNTRPDFIVDQKAAADASVCCKERCHTCFKTRTGKLQRRIRFRPGSTTPRSGLSTHFCTITDEPNTSDQAMPKRSKDSSFAQNWKGLFPRSKQLTPSCLPFVSLASYHEMTQSS